MNETKRPREFWIKATRVRNGVKSYTATLAPISVAGEIHVIEKSEYDDLKDRYELAVNSDNAWREKAETLEENLRVAIEALEYAISDISTGHWEDDCKVPKTYEPCDHCYLVGVLSKLKGGE